MTGFFITKPRMFPQQSYIFSGATMGYRVIGHGKPVILVHGSMIADPWCGFDKLLANYYSVYLPHLPGFGLSEAVPGKIHTTDLFALALNTFIRSHRLTHVPILAFSLGSVVAVKVAARQSSHGRLILVGLPIQIDSPEMERASALPVWLRRLIGSTTIGRRKILLPILRSVIGGTTGKEHDDKLLADLILTDTRSLVDLNLTREVNGEIPKLLKSLDKQTLYMYGENDPLLAVSQGYVKNPVLIKNADHNVFGTQPEETLREIRKHI